MTDTQLKMFLIDIARMLTGILKKIQDIIKEL